MSDTFNTIKKAVIHNITTHIGIVIIVVLCAAIYQKIATSKNKDLVPGVENIWLGIETMEINPDMVRQYNIHSCRGLLITRVFKGSTAEAAGILSGDVIRRWNGKSIISHKQFKRYIQKTHTNKKIRFSIERHGVPLLVYAKLGVRPGNFK